MPALVGIRIHRFDFQNEFRIGLIGRVFPRAFGLNDHAHDIALYKSIDGLHRRRKIHYVQLAFQRSGQGGFKKIHDQAAALLAHVDTDIRI